MVLTVGSLFSGIGGIDLGLERAGMKVIWQCEIDPYCQKVLRKHWPEVKLYDDIRELRGSELERPDVLCGGFPCQDISGARVGGEGIRGQRSGLFFEMLRLAGELRPKYWIMENVERLFTRGFDEVLKSISQVGYDAEWGTFQANWFGLPHKRRRVIIVAYPSSLRPHLDEAQKKDSNKGQYQGIWRQPPILYSDYAWDTSPVLSSDIRECDGVPNGLDTIGLRVKALGNAVIPQLGEYIGRQIVAFEEGN